MKYLAIAEHIGKICNRKDCGYFPTGEDSDQIVCFGCRHFKPADFSMLVSQGDSVMTEKLRFIGDSRMKQYVGDGLNCQVGAVVSVSPAKKAQLMRDCPQWWEEVGIVEEAAKKVEDQQPPIGEKPKLGKVDLEKLKKILIRAKNKDQINDIAVELKVPGVNPDAQVRREMIDTILKYLGG